MFPCFFFLLGQLQRAMGVGCAGNELSCCDVFFHPEDNNIIPPKQDEGTVSEDSFPSHFPLSPGMYVIEESHKVMFVIEIIIIVMI